MIGFASTSRAWRGTFAALAFGVAILAGLGCASGPVANTDMTPRPIALGTLVNDDLTIVANDGSFTLQGGRQFKTPFATSTLWSTSLTSQSLLEAYPQARAWGAQPVKIKQAGRQDLYGLLLFNNAIGAAFGSGSQSYYVRIAPEKLDNARNGNTAVSYELMDYTRAWTDGTSDKQVQYSWVLWISSTPI